MEKYCLDITNYEKKRVIFLEETRRIKSIKHPELRDEKFINNQVREAINNPDFVYQDYAHPDNRQVYYKFNYSVNGRNIYTKVVMALKENPLLVITAFRPDYVKERGKTQIIYGQYQ